MEAVDEPQGQAVEPAEAKPRKPGTFVKGDPRISHNQAKVVPVEVPEPADEVNDGAPSQLKAMRWAVRNHGVKCKGTPAEEAMREAYRKAPMRFVEMLTRQEQLFRESRPAGAKVSAVRDEGQERVEELLAECLERWNGGAG